MGKLEQIIDNMVSTNTCAPQTKKPVFYVVKRHTTDAAISAPYLAVSLGFYYTARLTEAEQYSSVAAALLGVAHRNRGYKGDLELGGDTLSIVRVEQETVPGAEKRIVLGHRANVPEGAQLRWVVENPVAPRGKHFRGDIGVHGFPALGSIDEATLYAALEDAIRSTNGMTGYHYRRVAVTQTDSTVKYTETVLA